MSATHHDARQQAVDHERLAEPLPEPERLACFKALGLVEPRPPLWKRLLGAG